MNKLLRKDYLKRKKIASFLFFKTVTSNILINRNFNFYLLHNLFLKYSDFLKKNSLVLLQGRCRFSKRPVKFNKFYRFSRLKLLNLLRSGLINGFTKGCW